jgi:hypothetical protein
MARRGKFGRAALLLGAAAVAAGVLLKKDKVTGLLSSGSQQPADTGWAPAPATGPSNYDAPGPVANTATPVPAPEPEVLTDTGAIDEAAEEAAAAAEAANIGGTVADYADIRDEDQVADEADRPLAEAGQGTSEGQEQAEAELEAAAGEPLVGASDFGGSIDDAIEEAAQPYAGERLEAPAEPLTPEADVPPAPEPTPAEAFSEPAAAEPIAEPAEAFSEPAAAEPTPAEPTPAEAFSEPAATEPPPAEPALPPVEPEPVAPPKPPEPEPTGQIPFGEGALGETPGVPQTEEPAAAEPPAEPEGEPQITPAAPQSGWQPPAPPEPPTEVQEPSPPTEEKKLPDEDDDDDDGDDWRTWSGQAIKP